MRRSPRRVRSLSAWAAVRVRRCRRRGRAAATPWSPAARSCRLTSTSAVAGRRTRRPALISYACAMPFRSRWPARAGRRPRAIPAAHDDELRVVDIELGEKAVAQIDAALEIVERRSSCRRFRWYRYETRSRTPNRRHDVVAALDAGNVRPISSTTPKLHGRDQYGSTRRRSAVLAREFLCRCRRRPRAARGRGHPAIIDVVQPRRRDVDQTRFLLAAAKNCHCFTDLANISSIVPRIAQIAGTDC